MHQKKKRLYKGTKLIFFYFSINADILVEHFQGLQGEENLHNHAHVENQIDEIERRENLPNRAHVENQTDENERRENLPNRAHVENQIDENQPPVRRSRRQKCPLNRLTL